MKSDEHITASHEALGRPIVLNVNDSEAARYTTTRMLRRGGFEVIEAPDGLTALALAEQLPDVVVLDVRLPDIDGFEVCRRIRANPRTARLKVLHTSATFVTIEKRVQGLKLGADGYLAQPFEAQELVATVQSLARLSKAEQGLYQRNELLLEADRRKDEFLAMLAHELRNPLSAISASLPLLSEHPPHSEHEARARQILERQVLHLGKLVDDLLDVARVTRGKIELQRDRVDLREVLGNVTHAARDTKIGLRRQTLTLALPEGPLPVRGDATRLEQIFVNLLDNASKYSEAGAPIEVEAARVKQGGDERVRVLVRDHGGGIAPDVLPSIFDLFAQAAVSIDRSRGGLGIGLSLVKSLVDLHGGTVTAQSDGLGKGSEFEVSFPLLAEPAEHASPVARSSVPPPEVDSGKRRILLIEDNEDARDGLVMLWEIWGHQVFAAGDGIEGIRVAEAEQPDVAFVDIGLPEMDGYEVARTLRASEKTRDLLLVALTGYGTAKEKQLALEAGFDHHMIKPVDPDLVKAFLADLRGARRTSQRKRG
jgi:signal transduction histidine kinase